MNLKGRISLLLPQVGGYSKHETREEEEPLFLYNDKGNDNDKLSNNCLFNPEPTTRAKSSNTNTA